MSTTPAQRVAARHLATSSPSAVVTEALRPVYVGDPDNLDLLVDDVLEHVRASLRRTATDIMSLKRFKVTGFGHRDAESNEFSYDASAHRQMRFWVQVEYPTSVTLRGRFKVDIEARWIAAVQATRGKVSGVPPLPREALEVFSDMMVEAVDLETSEHLSDEVEEHLQDALYADSMKGIDIETSTYETDSDGVEKEMTEGFDADARFRYDVDTTKVKVDIATYPADGKLGVDVVVPVKVRLRRLNSPWSHDYRR